MEGAAGAEAPSGARRPRRRGRLLAVCEYAEAILVAVILALFAKAFVFEAFEIPSGSMEETLLVGDHVLVNKFVHAPHRGPWARLLPYRDVALGEVVVFKSPSDAGVDLVKRVVGRAGDVLRIERKRLYRNGSAADEPFVLHRDVDVYVPGPGVPEALVGRDEMPGLTVPPGRFFAMGDNRDDSRDSRFYGTVPEELVKGQALVVYWSREDAPPVAEGRGAVLRRTVDGALHFFERTRWRRTFQRVR